MLVKPNRMSYPEALTHLYALQKYGIKFGLSQTVNLLNAFGNPHLGKNFVHVAGTNGKGSVAAMLSSILKESGLKVGFYSSPHLVRFTERFRINGVEMPAHTAASLTEELLSVISPDQPPTFFEAATAMALIYFARENTDIAVMEVGMGGRLDATNVIQPLASVITNISLEHQNFLGPRLIDIAREKGGIIKEGVDVFTGVTQPSVIRFLEERCREMNAPLFRLGKEIRFRAGKGGFHYYGIREKLKNLHLGLKGEYQSRNASLAIAAAESLRGKGFTISTGNIREGLRKAVWPGRMQVVSTAPVVLLDGAHNPGAMRALAKAVLSEFKGKRILLVIGVMGDKDIAGILREILPISDYVFYTRPVYPRAADPKDLMTEGAPYGKGGEVVQDLHRALERARETATSQDLVLVTGSLFTVGEAMTYFDPVAFAPEKV
jgi:dihydrofolate synthase / folylpolyglutamate synthase